MELALTVEDRKLLSEILERRLRELQKEIAHKDHRDFKALLRGNEKRIESMLGRLRMVLAARAS
jgi:hypothetical protein